MQGSAAETLRSRGGARRRVVALWADVDVKHSAPLAAREVAREAEDLVARGLADAVLVTGDGTGRAVDDEKLRRVRAVSRGAPVLAASGTTEGALVRLAALCDGVIVGSALRADGRPGGPVDASRAGAFARAFRQAFGV